MTPYEVRERCAEIAETVGIDYNQAGRSGGDYAVGARAACREIAAAIRALDLPAQTGGVLERSQFEQVADSIDRQTYDLVRRADYNLPDDAEVNLTFTMKEVRVLEAALCSYLHARPSPLPMVAVPKTVEAYEALARMSEHQGKLVTAAIWQSNADQLRAHPPSQHAGMEVTRQARVLSWAVDMFGPVARDPVERAARLIEEAAELVQAAGLSREAVDRIISRTYSRPAGELGQEIGGVAMTLEALAENAMFSVEEEAAREFSRITSKPKAAWQAKHAEKIAAGTADAALSPAQQDAPAEVLTLRQRAVTDEEVEAALAAIAVPGGNISVSAVIGGSFRGPQVLRAALEAAARVRAGKV